MTRRLACLAAAAALAACSGASTTSPPHTSLVVTASPTSVVANGTNAVTVHVEAATKAPITVRTLHGAFGSSSTAQIADVQGDVTLTTCDASKDASCATSFDVLASDADGNAGHVTVRFTALTSCASNCASDISCAGQSCTTSGGAAGTCSSSPAACVATSSGGGGACTVTETTEKTCSDGLDNDCNGKIDCADAACDGQQCKSGDPTWTCQSNACAPTSGYALLVEPARTRLAAGSSTPVVVTVKNSGVVAAGVQVTLSAAAGTIAVPTVATGNIGTATFTYTASNNPGIDTITATVTQPNGKQVSLDAKVTIPNLGSLALGSVLFDVMGVKGSGYQEQNQVVVQALDDAGKPYPDGLAITFTHVSLGASMLTATLPLAASCTPQAPCTTTTVPTSSPVDKPDSAGLASTWLLSGTLAGPYSVTASAMVGGVTRSFTFPTLFAIGAKASGLDFAVDCSPRNVPALAETDCSTSYVDASITCVARIKDRFGNLLGRQVPVMFRSEASGYGHVQTTPAFDPAQAATSQPDLGSAVELFRTHADGLPMDVAPAVGEPSVSHADDGCGVRTHNPRDGVVTIIAIADGEEAFVDINGNGVYDGPGSTNLPAAYQAKGEPFVDLGEPFVDANDNGVWDPGEWFYDANNNHQYDGPNGVWDPATKIWTQTVVVYTSAADGPWAALAPGNGLLVGTRWADNDADQFVNACTGTPAASDFAVNPPVAGPPAVPATAAYYVVVASDLNLNLLSTKTDYAVTVDAPGKVSATYTGSKNYADLLGFAYSYWPCSGGTCTNECTKPGACTMKPTVGPFSCGLAVDTTITGTSAADGPNVVRWTPWTTYPVYNGSHVATPTWPLSGTNAP